MSENLLPIISIEASKPTITSKLEKLGISVQTFKPIINHNNVSSADSFFLWDNTFFLLQEDGYKIIL